MEWIAYLQVAGKIVLLTLGMSLCSLTLLLLGIYAAVLADHRGKSRKDKYKTITEG